MLTAERLQVNMLITLHGDQVVIALLIIPNEKILGIGLRVRKRNLPSSAML
jgi:hypothetical protein